jgi:hypothetical protein
LKLKSRAVMAGLLVALCVPAQAAAQDVVLKPFGGTGFFNPYYVDSPPGDAERVMVVEGAGLIWLVKNGTRLPTPFLDIQDEVMGIGEEGCGGCGLFSIAFAPDYASSGLFYIHYTEDLPPEDGDYLIRVDELRRSASDPDVADPGYRRHVLALPYGDLHYGGQVAFGPDGYLYLSTGDGHDQTTPQDLTLPWGKLMRIDPRGSADGEYTPAPGNPFADGPGGNRDDIYAFGFRNLWRFSFDRATGDLAIADVQEDSWEEVSFVEEGGARGDNFGWPCFEATHPFPGPPAACTPPPSQTAPVLEYPHPAMQSAAITGGYIVRDPSLPSLYGRYLYTDSGYGLGGAIRSARLLETGAVDDADTGLGSYYLMVSFGEDACGHIYTTDLLTDQVNRIEPASGPITCKLAPAVSVDGATAARVAKRRAIVLQATCDEDCDLLAAGYVRVKRAAGRKPFSIAAQPSEVRLPMGQATTVRLELTKRAARRLHKALKAGRRAVANYGVSATGGGGGTESVGGQARQRR